MQTRIIELQEFIGSTVKKSVEIDSQIKKVREESSALGESMRGHLHDENFSEKYLKPAEKLSNKEKALTVKRREMRMSLEVAGNHLAFIIASGLRSEIKDGSLKGIPTRFKKFQDRFTAIVEKYKTDNFIVWLESSSDYSLWFGWSISNAPGHGYSLVNGKEYVCRKNNGMPEVDDTEKKGEIGTVAEIENLVKGYLKAEAQMFEAVKALEKKAEEVRHKYPWFEPVKYSQPSFIYGRMFTNL